MTWREECLSGVSRACHGEPSGQARGSWPGSQAVLHVLGNLRGFAHAPTFLCVSKVCGRRGRTSCEGVGRSGVKVLKG